MSKKYYIKKENKEEEILKEKNDRLISIMMGSQGSKAALEYVEKFINDLRNQSEPSKNSIKLCIFAGANTCPGSLYNQLQDLIVKNKNIIPKNVEIVPLGLQNGKHVVSVLQNSDIVVTKTGGLSSIEITKTQEKNKNRKILIHSEAKINSLLSFPVHNYDALYEALISGTVKWEGGNGECLLSKFDASLTNSQTADFITLENNQNLGHKSLFKMAYDNALVKANKKIIKNLILEGSNPNLKFPDNSYLIDNCEDFEIKKLLIEYGAKTTNKSFKNTGNKEKTELIGLSHKYNTPYIKAFKKAIESGNTKKIAGIIYNCNSIKDKWIEFKNSEYMSPIHYAISLKKNDVLEILLDAKAKAGVIDKNHGSALDYAIKENNITGIELLLRYNIDKDIRYKVMNYIRNPGKIDYEIIKLFVKYNLIRPYKNNISKISELQKEEIKEMIYEPENHYKNNELHRAIYYLNKNESVIKKMGRDLSSIIQDNIEKTNDVNIDNQTPISMCKNQENKEELVRWGANYRNAKDINSDDLKALKDIYTQHNDLIKNCKKFMLRNFNACKNYENFLEKIKNDIEKLYSGYKIFKEDKENKLNNTLKGLYNALQNHRTDTLDENIFVKFLDILKSIIGIDKVSKIFKESEIKENFNKLPKTMVKAT